MIHPSRLVVPLLGTLLLAPLAQADAQSISFGITGGASLSTFTGNISEDVKNYSTYLVGGFVRIGAMGFAVQPGLYYTGKGAKTENASGVAENTTKIQYIQVPLVLRLRLANMLYIGAGPAIGFKAGCKVALASSGYGAGEECSNEETGDQVKSTEVSGIVEAGIEFGKFSVGARGDLGLTNINFVEQLGQSGSTSNLGIKTRTVSVVAAIRF